MQQIQPYNEESFALLVQLANALGRPLCIVDIETTGFGHYAGIVEFGGLFVRLDGSRAYFNQRVNPICAIDSRASQVHGIYHEDVSHLPTFKAHNELAHYIFSNYAVGGFNSRSYDIPVITTNAYRYGQNLPNPMQLDVLKLWRRLTGEKKGKLTTISEAYGIPAGPAHTAFGDVLTTARLLEYLVEKVGLKAIMPAVAAETGIALAPAKIAQSDGRRQASPVACRAQSAPWEGLGLTKSAYACQAVLKYVEEHGHLPTAEYAALAARIGVEEASISFAISTLITESKLATAAVRDASLQARITPALFRAQMRAGSPHLRPLQTALKQILNEDSIDFVQIRVALIEQSARTHEHSSRPFPVATA